MKWVNKWVKKEEKTAAILHEMAKSKFDNVVVVENNKAIGILITKDIIELVKNKSDLELKCFPFHVLSSGDYKTRNNFNSRHIIKTNKINQT